ncbi:MAG: peptidoglycan DD-metalloendopeptidase family protein [Actinomycetota bacterium]
MVTTTPTAEGGTTPDGAPVGVDGGSTLVDPLVDEGPAEPPPETDATVPPRGGYNNQPEFLVTEILWSNVRAAEAKVEAAEAELATAIGEVRGARRRLKALTFRRAELDERNAETLAALDQAAVDLTERAVSAFVANDEVELQVLRNVHVASQDGILEAQTRARLVDAALDADDAALNRYREIRSQLEGEVLTVVDDTRLVERRLAAANERSDEAEERRAVAEAEAEVFRAGSVVHIPNMVFPILPPYDTPLIDSWGFPRMPGTPDEHWHEGIDLFAPSGAPLVAAERGVITRINTGRLGGLTFWLRGESGADWYYAHLLAYAEGLQVGQVVEAGQVVGYVGNTGNAIFTPPHLHLQLHPGGGPPVNPFPVMAVAEERSRLAIESPPQATGPDELMMVAGGEARIGATEAGLVGEGRPPTVTTLDRDGEPEQLRHQLGGEGGLDGASGE